MSEPWKKYQAQGDGPWTQYAAPQAEVAQETQTPPEAFPLGPVAKEAATTAITGPYDATKAMVENPDAIRRQAPLAGGILGTALGPLGPAAGTGLGQIVSRVAGMAYGTEAPAGSPASEAIGPMVQTALAGLPEVGGVKNAIKSGAQNLARRTLGFTKPMLKRWNFGVPEANKVGQEMLDKGVIKFGSSAESNLGRAKDLSEQSGNAIGETLSSTNAKIVDPKSISNTVEGQLAPEYGTHIERTFKQTPKFKEPLFTEEKVPGGAYDKTRNIVNEIERTVKAHGSSPVDFESAQTLKEKLGSIANFLKDQAPERSNLYRRAYGIVSDAIDKGLGTAAEQGAIPKEKLGAYMANKATYGASRRAIEGLTDKAAADAANSLLSLRGAAVGAGALATGNVPKAMEAVGAWELLRRRGAGMGAVALNAISHASPVVSSGRRALITQFVEHMIHGGTQ